MSILTYLQTDLLPNIFDRIDFLTAGIFLPLAILYAILGLDELFVDLYFWIRRLGPRKLSANDIIEMNSLPEKKMAIMVAGWQEETVLGGMVKGNLQGIHYENYDFFLGVYPNDKGTFKVAKKLEKVHSNVHVVINTEEGPTCKGQMLNQVVREIKRYEKDHDSQFDVIMFHDCEDIIHPLALKLINIYAEDYDFIQVPVFSLPVKISNLVAGTYMDEFSESHLKNLAVRNKMKCAIPSAGVGTAMSRKLVQTFLGKQNGNLMNPGALTEDYELGMLSPRFGLKSVFACAYYKNLNGEKEFIATREYFPKSFWRSVRQKSRWTLGIVFQGTKNLGWGKTLKENYFLYRDRKGVFTTPLALVAMFIFGYGIIRMSVNPESYLSVSVLYPSLNNCIPYLVGFNVTLLLNRFFQRFYFGQFVYGIIIGLFSPFRFVLGNFVNAFASCKAIDQWVKSKITGKAPVWIKTTHEIPQDFSAGSGSGLIDSLVMKPANLDQTTHK